MNRRLYNNQSFVLMAVPSILYLTYPKLPSVFWLLDSFADRVEKCIYSKILSTLPCV
ncbi:MAG: hypothetical protein V7L26_23795 [Nostoc sp.]|uniref:hypothetical protein n=1 Tax=Nostoc sp. TaxID=1180 RepID=UPI002FFD30A1